MTIGGVRIPVVDEGDIMADEHLILQCDALAQKGMAGNLAALPDFGAPLDLDKRSDLGFVPDLAPVQVHEACDVHRPAQFYVRSNSLKVAGHF